MIAIVKKKKKVLKESGCITPDHKNQIMSHTMRYVYPKESAESFGEPEQVLEWLFSLDTEIQAEAGLASAPWNSNNCVALDSMYRIPILPSHY